jgi:hypothetical protein
MSVEPYPQHDQAGPLDRGRMDSMIGDAAHLYGGLCNGEYPIVNILISETRGWNGPDGFTDLHWWPTEGASARHVIKLLEDVIEGLRQQSRRR